MTIGAPSARGPREQPEALDELPTASAPLVELYACGRRPGPLVGVWRGRLLLSFAPRALVRRLPWEGRSFGHDVGTNRVRGSDRFPFHLRHGTSALDGEPCLLLDHDRAENPAVVRRLLDELREVGPGLYLGPAFVRLGRRLLRWGWLALGP